MSDDGPAAEDTRIGWWGDYDLPIGEARGWHVPPLRLTVIRFAQEWQLASQFDEEDTIESEHWTVDAEAAMPEEPEHLERHAFRQARGPLRLLPVPADRPVVTSPRVPLFIASGEESTVYVGSPLWIRVQVGSPPATISEFPLRRPSDTWFGPSTREGEICYATRTRGSLDVANLPLLARRAITPVLIRNRSDEPLQVERLKLPVPYLSLYATPRAQLWTSGVTMERHAATEMATFDVLRGPPRGAGKATRVVEPRERSAPGLLIRAFSLLGASES